MFIYLGNDKENSDFRCLNDVGNIIAVGATGSEKSVFIHSNINYFLQKYNSSDLLLYLIQPVKYEFSHYRKLKEPVIFSIISTNEETHKMLDLLLEESEKRLISKVTKPNILVICDEFAVMTDDDKAISKKFANIMKYSRQTKIYFLFVSQIAKYPDSIYKNAETKINFRVVYKEDTLRCFYKKAFEALKCTGDIVIRNETLFGTNTAFRHIDMEMQDKKFSKDKNNN